MNDFYIALDYVSNAIYEPNGFEVMSAQEEKHNAQYGAGNFRLSSKSVRFRVAKITPTKAGQFVAFWEKDENGQNQAYAYEASPDLIVVTTFKNQSEFGQFIFPKALLLKQKILSTDLIKGKMGIRVYPSWDTPTSKQAIASQKWQLPYFITNRTPLEKINQLYS